VGSGGLYDPVNMPLLHHINQGLRAHTLYKRDVDYMIKDGQVVIVDEFTGRLMPGRRWSDGLHQAVEAKEKVKIERENQTLATITFQNYFRKYKTLSGMTGTADTEAAEFAKIYNLDVVIIPPNRPLRRVEEPDSIYRTEREKYEAIVSDIAEKQQTGRPVLVGTVSIEKSERLSSMLKKRGGIKHVVLNAKYHAQEAEIVAQAGRKGTVTIATNMAGRGTDILLGGNPDFLFKRILYQDEELSEERKKTIYEQIKAECEADKKEVIALGGLHILGTERHESRRIDNQLRGRAGRQGDPGSSRFYLSLEDDLLRIFASERISNLMLKLGMEEGVPIEHRMVTRAIENAQKKVEAHNFDIRKQLLEYDDVMNKQREVIYQHRRTILTGDDLSGETQEMVEEVVDSLIDVYSPEDQYPEEWDLTGLTEAAQAQFGMDVSRQEDGTTGGLKELGREALREEILERAQHAYHRKEKELGTDLFRYLEKMVLLQVIDHHWKDHLLAMDQLRDGIGLRGYGQKDPLIEYKREGFDMFAAMMGRIKGDTLDRLFHVQAVRESPPPVVQSAAPPRMILNRGEEPVAQQTVHRDHDKVGRNDPCPCGSGKKYKKCHGR
jgi:preprotein translocase subunit SecA